MNSFIGYLNSTNNASSDTTGALAEAQVKSEYFDKIKVDRKLGTYIVQNVKSGNHKAYILTGHAGDGKTSILVQVLKSLSYLEDGKGLHPQKEFNNFYYVKDMSEINEVEQPLVLKKALDSPSYGKTSLLITNTGPLLKSFMKLAKEKADDFNEIELQSQLLDQLDKNKNDSIHVAGYEFILVNIARVDNTSFAKKLLNNILIDELWIPCKECPKNDVCPIYSNKLTVHKHIERVINFIENFYRYLYENDKRMTIRQMLGQLSYALTGNLTCEEIKTKLYKNPKFDFNFANLFFGYQGLKEIADASQIKGVQQIRALSLDNKALYDDYQLFVTHDFSKLPPEVDDIINEVLKKYRKSYRVLNYEDQTSKTQQIEIQLRKAIRRFYLMYSMYEVNSDVDLVMDQIFGKMFTCYKTMITKKQTGQRLANEIQRILFQALYLKNTGFLPSRYKDDLPLTLRREDDVFQNVMLTTGTVKKSDLSLVQLQDENQFEDSEQKFSIVLRLDGSHDFKLTLPLISYFGSLIDGAIASNNNPALTHGIAQLDALLYEKFSDNRVIGELSILVNTINGQQKYTYGFENGKIYLD